MKDVAILIHEDAVLSTVSGAMDMLIHTNRFFHEKGKPLPFKIMLVGQEPENRFLRNPEPYVSYCPIDKLEKPGLIIVPAFYGDRTLSLEKHKNLIEWVSSKNKTGSEVASLCSGSYFLAEGGLLAGRSCTSHWFDRDDIVSRYPDVNFLSDMVITDDRGIYTSGGAFSSLNLVLYLIDKFCGRDVGVWASKMFSLDMDRTSQSHFSVFMGQHSHSDEDILKAQQYIEQNHHQQLNIDDIAGHSNMSKRNFIRRFKKATQNTPFEYLQRVKIEAAKKALEKGAQNINILMYDAGYNDIKTFREVFKKITGLTPQDYRRKYSRDMPMQERVDVYSTINMVN
ncbi:GlxA family transcriptional regulator [Mucilaginibacter sp. L3T2-6]|uniref:GlxA family transcriptional regulator n=1 Tax=Mucilaginibacter sp. L3T2-6 TaxID=3062491 RepID=UPI0026749463|nr:helix-turn-helix domain-containing protein [Mucilaginibacter sp. L3T2-6]MDO3641869.1 helix-turn-helix domain-containing protein [Mucilaginibacter sp. L3T2-6]MDV6214453.1 helix-turn-helix domain-containing protein [Mucilaginibacter sp. L3T2-6]